MAASLGLQILHDLVSVFFGILIFLLFVRGLVSFIPDIQAHPIVRFLMNVVDPLVEPIHRRLPRLTLGPLDLSWTLAFLFVFWALSTFSALINYALPS